MKLVCFFLLILSLSPSSLWADLLSFDIRTNGEKRNRVVWVAELISLDSTTQLAEFEYNTISGNSGSFRVHSSRVFSLEFRDSLEPMNEDWPARNDHRDLTVPVPTSKPRIWKRSVLLDNTGGLANLSLPQVALVEPPSREGTELRVSAEILSISEGNVDLLMTLPGGGSMRLTLDRSLIKTWFRG